MPAISSSPNRSYAKLAIVLGTLTAFGPLTIDMYLPGLPAIAQEYRVDASVVQQTLAVFFIGLAFGQAIYGPISDRVGRRAPLIFGCTLYALASIGCAFAFSIESLIVLRFIQALGACAGMVISRSVVRDLFDHQESARMYSFLMLVMGLAPITAPLIGGQLLRYFGWRSIFVTLAVFGLACIVLVITSLQESHPVERRTRAGLGAVLLGYGQILRERTFVGFALAGGLASASMFAYISGSPFVFIELNGVAPEQYGFLFGLNAFGLIGAAQLNRWLLTRYHGNRILTVALSGTALAGLLLVAVTASGFGGFPAMLVVLFFCIAGTGFVGPNATAAAMAPFGKAAGSASALLGAIQFSLGASAGALLGLLHNGTALPMAITVALASGGALIALRVLALRPQPQPAAV
jgi:MFS transporter, DHA1 family, multidrug resistance protein